MQFTSAAAAVEPQNIEEDIPTVCDLGEEVMQIRDRQGVRGIERERSRFRRHIIPSVIAHKLVTEVAPRDVREWLRWMQQKPALTKGPKAVPTDRQLDPQSINRAYSSLSAIFIEAVERELITTNPCIGVKLKKIATEADTVQRWSYLTRAEQRQIVGCCVLPLELKLPVMFAWSTGLRQGEQMNLEIPDLIVDGPNPRVIVRYSNMHKGKKAPPKNKKIREVALSDEALAASKLWLELLPSFAPENPHGLVFPLSYGSRRHQGKPLGRDVTIHDVYRIAGVKPRRGLHWHALRHTFASNCVATGLPLEVTQVLMGHSSVTITQRYAHLGDDDVAKQFRKFMNGARDAA